MNQQLTHRSDARRAEIRARAFTTFLASNGVPPLTDERRAELRARREAAQARIADARNAMHTHTRGPA